MMLLNTAKILDFFLYSGSHWDEASLPAWPSGFLFFPMSPLQQIGCGWVGGDIAGAVDLNQKTHAI